MYMKINILGSSSSGNSFLFSHDSTHILIDVGFSRSYLAKKLDELGIKFEDIDAIFISHEHKDHCKGLNSLQKTHKVYSSPGTIESLIDCYPNLRFELINDTIKIGLLEIISFKTNHDAKEPIGFIVKDDKRCVLTLTDFGSYDEELLFFLSKFQFTDLIIESNYDCFLLDHGKYPFLLKERIKGKYGHSSNMDSIRFLTKMNLSKTKNIILCHLSKNNNSPKIVLELFKSIFGLSHNIYVVKENEILKIYD